MQDTLKELDAMKCIAEALTELEDDSKRRVLKWVTDHFSLDFQPSNPIVSSNNQRNLTAQDPVSMSSQLTHSLVSDEGFDTAADFYAHLQPNSHAEKVLVVMYWLQKFEGNLEIKALTVNNILKDMGYRIGNITSAFDALKNTKPQLVIQIKKGGTSKQARKKYKLTTEGLKKVESLLSSVNLN